ncbi:MAG: hypothetical protein P4M04_04775 [Acidobacteriota bacterium]|nr:hypothetical protein [Acidobacteriota bacterium]
MTTTARYQRRLRDPVFLLSLVAALSAFVIQSGELGTADTTVRLQTTHWLWTSQPQVPSGELLVFGLHGRDGKLYSWYGIGQSLIFLPADLVGTFLEHLPIFANYDGTDPGVRSIVVSYSTNILINVLTAMVCFRFLRLLGFTTRQAVAGVLALLFCTTHLHYAQNMMENNYILLLTMTGLTWQYEWLQTGSRRALAIGSAAFGLNLLTRLTTGLDLLAGGVFLLLVLWFDGVRSRALWFRIVSYCQIVAPVYLFFLLIDRVYQYYRFGSFTNTYVSIVAREQRALNPSLPANYPWEVPFRVGFFGALFTPEKSIFLVDPLVVLAILLAVVTWKRLRNDVRAYLLTAFLLLFAYISFYARYSVWSGDFAWGDRYVSTAAEMVAFISVPILLRYRHNLAKSIWWLGTLLIAISAVVQLASLAFWLPLEIYQMETMGHPTFVIALRFKNIAAFALGRMEQWGLNNIPMTQDPWDYVHITTWNFLPFLLRRVGVAQRWVVDVAFLVWVTGLAALAWAFRRLCKMLAISHDPPPLEGSATEPQAAS